MLSKSQTPKTEKASTTSSFTNRATKQPARPQSHSADIIQRAERDPSTLTQSDIIQLQRTIGNQAVAQLFAESTQSPPVPKTENKTGLPNTLKAGIENLSGLSMDDVRVHYNSTKPAQLQALAYTQGAGIHVGPRQERHLPHEGWHVVQQRQGRVKATSQYMGAAINDDRELEREANTMGNRALHASNSIRLHALKKRESSKRATVGLVPSFGQSMENETAVEQGRVIQRYNTEKNEHDKKLYNISENAKLICGLTYPNHDLYVQDKGMVDQVNSSLDKGEGRIKFKLGKERKDFIGDQSYTQIEPQYKNEKEVDPKIALKEACQIKQELGKKGREAKPGEMTHIAEINRENEAFRKIAMEYILKQDSDPEHLKENLIAAYQIVDGFLDGNNKRKETLKKLNELIEVLDKKGPKTNATFLQAQEILSTLIGKVKTIKRSTPDKRKSAYATQLEEYGKGTDISLPKGCDLVAGVILGGKEIDSSDTEKSKISLLFYDFGAESKHHYATRILNDDSDFVTLEGFAKKGYFHFDNTWEFIMYGDKKGRQEEFKRVTDIRYTFKGHIPDNSYVVDRGTEPYNYKLANYFYEFKAKEFEDKEFEPKDFKPSLGTKLMNLFKR